VSKVLERHLERKACVYVRQSSMAQVYHHKESTERQYNLRERASVLGWSGEQIEVIDDDQGQSGASAEGRSGFQRLVAEVALGEVGAVLGLEVSRLARSCADWYRLLEVAALTGTLIIDEDGVYDPNHYNDRLLLGLKGTMSEAELHFLKSRMIGGRRNKARRGEYHIRLPVGYIWEDEILLDPDELVRDAVTMLFRCFERCGSAAAVARHFDDSHLAFPRRDGWGSRDACVTWGALSISRVIHVLRNPIYAGIYAYARKCSHEEDPEDPGKGGRILIPGSHPGYITVEQYERNIQRLVENRNIYGGMRNKGAAREGGSLLQGMVLCGRCGRPMNVNYGKKDIKYTCRLLYTRRRCQEINMRHVEPLIEKIIMESVCGKELGIGLKALEKLSHRSRELEEQWQKRLEATRYEAQKAARRYRQVDPENRLVARTLESEWNRKLEELEHLTQEYEEARHKPPIVLSESQRKKILALAEDLPRLWRSPTTLQSQRKQVIRLLIEDITLNNVDSPWSIEVAIRWKTGVVTRHSCQRVVFHPQETAPEVVEKIVSLYREKTDGEIADILNREGHRSGYGKEFTVNSITHIRYSRGLIKYRKKTGGEKSPS
jgi:DNA invertase Pin-like site-specific DNA recombinase